MKNKKILLLVILAVAMFLRLYKISQVPVSLFGDELDVGYQAYSILKTGKDYYGNPWPIHFQSLAEYRTPLYLYSAVPTVAAFGISPLGVRLPAVLFGILSIWIFYLLIKQLFKDEKLALLSAAVLTFSPWHIQYSRAAFEVTQLLFLLLLSLLLFFKSFKKGKYLWLSAASFALTPWVYSTVKLFTPLLLVFLFLIWHKEILKLPKRSLLIAFCSLLLIGGPIAYSTVFGGGGQRFGYISVFTDPTVETEVGVDRELDAHVRGETGIGLSPTLTDRSFHNKFTFWGSNILKNYFQPFSTDFLFVKGDLNLRHSIEGVGQFYMVEAITLILGVVFFFSSKADWKTKALIGFWILAGVIPAAITRDGGRHATRLIVILPPLAFLIGYGLSKITGYRLLITGYLLLFAANFIAYQHNFWVHNPWYSERWWHSGWDPAIHAVSDLGKDYDRVVITMSDEPPWTFFAAHMMYDPVAWQANFPTENWYDDPIFGRVTKIDKYTFASMPGDGMYSWWKVLDNKTLYLASEKEVGINLILEPDRTPSDLKLVKAIPYPSGLPAFYLLSGKEI